MARARTRRPLPDREMGPEELAEFLGVHRTGIYDYLKLPGAPKARYLRPGHPRWLLSDWQAFHRSRPEAGPSDVEAVGEA